MIDVFRSVGCMDSLNCWIHITDLNILRMTIPAILNINKNRPIMKGIFHGGEHLAVTVILSEKPGWKPAISIGFQ